MSNLTDDEYTVAMLAHQGQYLAPIGRWEKPIRDMHARGLLNKIDDSNYIANQATRAALMKHEEGIDNEFRRAIEANNNIANASTQAQQSIRQSALHLSFAAKAAALATGETPEQAVKKWLGAVEKEALELVGK